MKEKPRHEARGGIKGDDGEQTPHDAKQNSTTGKPK